MSLNRYAPLLCTDRIAIPYACVYAGFKIYLQRCRAVGGCLVQRIVLYLFVCGGGVLQIYFIRLPVEGEYVI